MESKLITNIIVLRKADKEKTKDLEDLIIAVKKKVLEKTGISLETEIQIIGEHV